MSNPFKKGDIVRAKEDNNLHLSCQSEFVVFATNANLIFIVDENCDTYQWEHEDFKFVESQPKVTVEQIREFVLNEARRVNFEELDLIYVDELLQLIDNGPKKPTPEEIALQSIWSGCAGSLNQCERDSSSVVSALREAGYINE